MEIAKALILAGGTSQAASWPSIHSGPRHLVPVANRPILFHNLEALRHANLLEAAIAVEPGAAAPTIAAVHDGARWGLNVSYVDWEPESGLSGALDAAADFIDGEPVLVEPADALHRERIRPHIAAFSHEGLDAMELWLGDAMIGAPQTTAGGYLLSDRGVSILRWRDEADPMTQVRREGGYVRVQRIDGCLACHGSQDRLLEGNRQMLELLTGSDARGVLINTELQGPVCIHPAARVEHSLIRGPAIIGPGSTIAHAYIGPYTSVGTDVVLEGSQIEHSIVLDGAEIRHVGSRLESCVIGRGARIRRSFGLPATMRLSVGDDAEITLG